MLWLVKMIEVPDLRVEQGFTAAQPEDKTTPEHPRKLHVASCPVLFHYNLLEVMGHEITATRFHLLMALMLNQKINNIEIRENSVSTGNQPPDGVDSLPHLPPGGRVHPCCRLVQQHHLWPGVCAILLLLLNLDRSCT